MEKEKALAIQNLITDMEKEKALLKDNLDSEQVIIDNLREQIEELKYSKS